MSVPSIGDLIRTIAYPEVVEVSPGKGKVVLAPDPSLGMGEEEFLITDEHYVPQKGATRKDMHLQVAKLHLRDAMAHLQLARWHDTAMERTRREVAAELKVSLSALEPNNSQLLLDEILRLRAQLAKEGQA